MSQGTKTAFVRMFGSAVAMQAVLSATSFIVGLILIRRAPSDQYGYYVLTLNMISLLVGLQNTFIQPQMIVRMARATPGERSELIGGLYRGQLRLWPVLGGIALIVALGSFLVGTHSWQTSVIVLAASFAIAASLQREFFRLVLLAYRRPEPVLRSDAVYAVLLIVGAFLATLTPLPAAAAAIMLGLAALVGWRLSSRSLWQFEAWDIRGAPGILRAIAPFGVWSASGTAVHWLLSQGYNFLVAATLDVRAVAAIAATRLLIMPINLVSTGIGALMLPTATRWLEHHGAASVLRRLVLISLGLAICALSYFGFVWIFRDWIFAHVLKKELPERDLLILLWFAVSLLMLVRDQLLYLPLARTRYKPLFFLTLLSTVISLTISYLAMLRSGVSGALIGVLCGELFNVSGLIVLSLLEVRRDAQAAASAAAAS